MQNTVLVGPMVAAKSTVGWRLGLLPKRELTETKPNLLSASAEPTRSGGALCQVNQPLADRFPGSRWCFPRPIGESAPLQGGLALDDGFASDHQLNQSVSCSPGMRWNSAVLCVTRVVL